MLCDSTWALGCLSSSYVLSTMLEPSMYFLTQSSHSIFSGRFCYLCFTGEHTKASRDGELHLGLEMLPRRPPSFSPGP